MDVDTRESPLRMLAAWIREARKLGIKDPDAMALATATPAGQPSVRMVLCRGIDDDGLRFFTNYESRKGRELATNGHAAVVFHWRELDRQVRVEGEVSQVSPEVSDEYFASRPRGNQIASIVSPQSLSIVSLEELQQRYDTLEVELAGRDSRAPRTGAASASVRPRWSCGGRARSGFTSASATNDTAARGWAHAGLRDPRRGRPRRSAARVRPPRHRDPRQADPRPPPRGARLRLDVA